MNMRLNDLLIPKKTAIIKKWFALAIDTYPADTAKFLKSQKDPFANPVGRTIYRGLEALFDELLKGMDIENITSHLDPIIRIRAVQNFSPSRAIRFIFFLKTAINESLSKEIFQEQLIKDWQLFESKIDELSLIAFNLYTQCKEKLFELKANEIKNRTFKAFERAGLVSEIPAEAPNLEPINHITKEASDDV
ncbi:MAG: RsbRD N-terminal domain-containing protein [Desulfobacterales bacterium]|nr:MAG: RsbRD N-terminal domain-containing protein [Desulfobacterales bacterium]